MYPKLKGSIKWAIICCNASDRSPLEKLSLTNIRDFISKDGAEGLFDYWKQVSFDSIDLKGSEVFGWYKLSFTVEQIKKWDDRHTIIQEAKKVAIKNGIKNLSSFKHSLVIITEFMNSGNSGNDIVLGMVDRPGQSNWRWCKKCQVLAFWDGSRKPGPCPAGERHEHLESSLYSLKHDTKIGGQNNWRWCSKCEGLVHGVLVGKCPGGGNHELEMIFDYVLYTGPISGAQVVQM
jgi:hypothetical protein